MLLKIPRRTRPILRRRGLPALKLAAGIGAAGELEVLVFEQLARREARDPGTVSLERQVRASISALSICSRKSAGAAFYERERPAMAPHFVATPCLD